MLGHILGRGENSRLYRALVVDKKIAVSAGADYSGIALDYTRLSVSGAPKPGVALTEIEEAIDVVLADISENGVTSDELDRAKNRIIADTVYAQDNQGALARWYGAALTTGRSIELIIGWPERVRTVTAENVHKAARQWLDKHRSVTGYLVKETPSTEKRA